MSAPHSHELVLDRTLEAPRDMVWRCYTEGALLQQWFCPRPWGVAKAVLDVRPGGGQEIVMQSPEGEQFPSFGIYLQVEPGRRLVYTNVFREGWIPAAAAHMDLRLLVDLSFESVENDHCRYVARVRHWSSEDCQQHADMGFDVGWNLAADQLEDLARSL